MDERFNMHVEEVTFSVDGKEVSFDDLNPKQSITVNEKFNVNDKVILKKSYEIILIKHVDYRVLDMFNFDYAGVLVGDESGNLKLFNQKDILDLYNELENGKSR